MRELTLKSALLCLLLACGTVAAKADPPVITHHVLHVAGRAIPYTAEAGFVPLTDGKTAEVRGNIFYTAYILPGKKRPVAFVWNGGPGASSTWVHFRGFGPRRLEGTTFVDNEDTPLPAADLVFVDPVGTGYSRPSKVEYGKDYFSTTGDAAATAQFITTWLKEHHAEDRPVFMIGESFGVYRIGGATERLESAGLHIAGVVLISGGSASGPLIPRNVRTALVTPQRAATALALGKTPPDLGTKRGDVVRAATQWSLDTYLPALGQVSKLTTAERDAVATDLARFTGYPVDKIDRKTLVIGRDYLKVMSPDPSKPLTTYDMRTTETPAFDASALNHYFTQELGLHTDLAYWDLNVDDPMHAGGKNWVNNYRWPESAKFGSDYAEPWLPKAMEINPKIKVWVAAGQYDSLNSCAENNVLRAMLEPDLARNYTMRCYLGGHMMYRDPDTRVTLSSDIRNFIADTLRAN